MNRSILLTLATAAAAAFCAAPASAQVVTGRVIEAETQRPLPDVNLRLRAATGQIVSQTMTDTAGKFAMQAPRLARFTLIAELIGMETVATEEVEVQIGAVEVLVRMGATAVPLEPLTVQARSTAELGALRGYYERMQWHERTGNGRFITRDQIEFRNPINVSDMLREIPRMSVRQDQRRGAFVTVRGSRAECSPAVFVDGMLTNRRDRAYVDELIRPGDLEGVEIYSGLAQLPGIYHDDSGCGVLLFWTRRGNDSRGARPFTWGRLIAGVSALGLLLLLGR